MAFADILGVSPMAVVGGPVVPMEYPAVVQSGRIILAIILDRGLSGSPIIPAGWTQELGYSMFAPLYSRLHIFSRVSDGTESGSIDFDLQVTNRKIGVMISTDAESIYEIGQSSFEEGLSINHAQITPTVDELRLLYIFGAFNLDAVPDMDDFNVAEELVGQAGHDLLPNSMYFGIGQQWHFGQVETPVKTSTTTYPGATPILVQSTVALFKSGPVTQLVLSVDGDDQLVDGQQGVSVLHQSFANPIESVILRATDGVTSFAKGLNFTAGTGDEVLVDMPDLAATSVEETAVPLSGGRFNLSLELGDGVSTAYRNVTVSPKATHAVSYVVDSLNQVGSIFYNPDPGVDSDPANDCQIIYDTLGGDVEIINNGIILTNTDPGDIVTAKVFDVEDGNIKPVAVQLTSFIPDDEAAQIIFFDLAGVPFTTAEWHVSNIVDIEDINLPVDCYVTSNDGGQFRLRAGEQGEWSQWYEVGTTVDAEAGYQAEVRVKNSLSPETQTGVRLYVGTVSNGFEVTTREVQDLSVIVDESPVSVQNGPFDITLYAGGDPFAAESDPPSVQITGNPGSTFDVAASDAGEYWTLTITPTEVGYVGDVEVLFPVRSLQSADRLLENFAEVGPVTVSVDLLSPSPVMTVAVGTQTGDFVIDILFDESVTGTLEPSDFTVTNGAVESVTGSDGIYVATIAPALEYAGDVVVTLHAGVVFDVAGNGNIEGALTVPVDLISPIVTLVGGAVTLKEGDTYIEPGYSASDNSGAIDLTDDVVVTSTVDTNTEGLYSVEYSVTDAAGNESVPVYRTVVVIPDQLAPQEAMSARVYLLPAADDGEPTVLYEGNTNYVVASEIAGVFSGSDIEIVNVECALCREGALVFGNYSATESGNRWLLTIPHDAPLTTGDELELRVSIVAVDGAVGHWEIPVTVADRAD